MNSENKREPWRIIVGIIAIAYIIFMWVKKDIVSIYATMPPEEVIPLIVTTVVVTFVKVALITVGILVIKWGIRKVQKKVF